MVNFDMNLEYYFLIFCCIIKYLPQQIYLRFCNELTIFSIIIYSHSIVAGGFELISYTTRLTPLTLFIILFDISAKKS